MPIPARELLGQIIELRNRLKEAILEKSAKIALYGWAGKICGFCKMFFGKICGFRKMFLDKICGFRKMLPAGMAELGDLIGFLFAPHFILASSSSPLISIAALRAEIEAPTIPGSKILCPAK